MKNNFSKGGEGGNNRKSTNKPVKKFYNSLTDKGKEERDEEEESFQPAPETNLSDLEESKKQLKEVNLAYENGIKYF